DATDSHGSFLDLASGATAALAGGSRLNGSLPAQYSVTAPLVDFHRSEDLRHQRAHLVRLPGHEIQPAPTPQHPPRAPHEQLGDRKLSIIWRVGQHHIEGIARQFFESARRHEAKL